jgi:uncharacterized protein YjbI with pentapeptide repeats
MALNPFDIILNDASFDVFDRKLLGSKIWKELRQRIKGPLMLHGADLRNLPLYDADLSDCELGEADLTGIEAEGIKFNRANLSGAKLCGAKIQFRCEWKEASCQDTYLSRCTIRGITFEGNWRRARFVDATFTNVRFDEKVNFEGADFTRCKMKAALFMGSGFRSALARLSQLQRTHLQGG